jgi:drug/metabolite transporter (DMT)-like permease
MATPSRPLIGAVFVLLTLIWSTTWAGIKIGLDGIPPFTGAALRFTLASLILFAVAPLLGVRLWRLARRREERRMWAFNAFFNFMVPYAVVYWSQQWVPSGWGAVLFATFPLFVAVFAHWILPEERLSVFGAVGTVIGFGGVAVIFSEDLERFGGSIVVVAAAVSLLGPLTSAVAEVVVKRWGAGFHPVSLSAVPMSLTAVAMALAAGALEREEAITVTSTNAGAVLYLAVFGSALSFGLYFWLLRHMRATHLALMTYLIPLLATSIGTFFLNEPFTWRLVAGGGLILGGVFLASRGT